MNPKFAAVVTALSALIVFSARLACSQIVADILILKSGRKVEGRITTESDISLTISTETATGKTERRMIARSDISSIERSERLAPSPTAEPSKHEIPEESSISPDQKWEYQGADEGGPRIVKAGTSEMAWDLSDVCDISTCGAGAAVVWAPDSKRFAFNWGQGRELHTALYQLREDHWAALKSPSDDDRISQRADSIIAGQLKSSGLSKKKLSQKGRYLRLIWWTVKVDEWLDSNTAILHASLRQVSARRDDPGEIEDEFSADLLFTLRFDDAGKWKIVKTHRMSDKEVEEHE